MVTATEQFVADFPKHKGLSVTNIWQPLSFGVSESMAIKSLANCSVLLVTTLILPLDCLSHQ
jgi:hypothetical protein